MTTGPASRLILVDAADAPAGRRASRETPEERARRRAERARRRAERDALFVALRTLPPGKALRVDNVPRNLRATWRGRGRAASKSLGTEFAVRARGETVWLVRAE